MKVIAFTCTTITVFLLIGAVSSSDWVNSEGWREGLFVQCIDPGAPTPIPFGTDPVPGCHKAHSAGYVRGTAALLVICVLTDFFGTLLTGLGLRSTDPNKKYKYYRVAIYALLVAVFALTLAAIIYPVQFSKDLANEPPKSGAVLEPITHKGSLDFDGDGIIDVVDNDDDNDGKPDDVDDDDDNDGVPDVEDEDDDNDGIPDTVDKDDDNDGIPDLMEEDSDGDGEVDAIDEDDGINDEEDDEDQDNDGVPDDEDNDDDNDGVDDDEDNDDDNDGVPDDQEDDDTLDNDSDDDGVPDDQDNDDDGDGVPDDQDNDDDGDGIPDEDDLEGGARTYELGFGYGATWGCIILIFASVVLLICDRESEEIFYKERQIEDEEEGEEEA